MPKNRHLRALVAAFIIAATVAAYSVDYTVKKGDSLWRIAREHNVSLNDLVEANNIANPRLIHIGQVLVIPGQDSGSGSSGGGSSSSPSPGGSDVYVVVRGDSLSKIARRFGTTVSALVAANNISNPSLIHVGQKIAVNGSSGSSPKSEPSPSSDPNKRSGRFHVVQPGQSISEVARILGVSREQLIRANGMVDGRIYARARLFADGPSYTPPSGGGGKTSTYTVKAWRHPFSHCFEALHLRFEIGGRQQHLQSQPDSSRADSQSREWWFRKQLGMPGSRRPFHQ